MAITQPEQGRWLAYCLAAALLPSAVGNVATAQDGIGAAAIRGQSPIGYDSYPQSVPYYQPAPFTAAASPWITVSQASAGPPETFSGGPPLMMSQGPFDPGYQQPLFGGGSDPSLAGVFQGTPAIWQPYVAAQGKAGNYSSNVFGQLMMPLYQDGQSLFFADIRGRWDDSSNSEGNFGLAVRTMIDPTWFVGMYGFYDYKRTGYGNSFSQGTIGAEAMSVLYEARVNGYVPESGAKHANQLTSAQLVGNTIFVSGGFERAYYGVDGEVGALLGEQQGGNLELRGFVGGYYFDTGAAGFPVIAGPKGRLEVRAYDVPWFGPGSRLTFGVELQYDNVRNTQVAGLARLEIPIGFFGGARQLTRLERRMLDRIVRDDDIITVAKQSPRETGVDALTGRTLNNVTFVDANTAAGTIPTVVANAGLTNNSTVVVDGFAGPISAHNIVVADGQIFRGGGFQVVGMDTGATTTFGTRPTINNPDGTFTTDTVIMSNGPKGSTVADLDLTGGRHGIASAANGTVNLTGPVVVEGNHVTGANSSAFAFAAVTDSHSSFLNNIATSSGRDSAGNIINAGADGFLFNGAFAGAASGNVAANNALNGFGFINLAGGTVTGNTATGNGFGGIGISAIAAGSTLSGNTANNNVQFGIGFNSIAGGTVSNNIADNNGRDLAGNVVNANADGFKFFGLGPVAGTVSGNTANNNTRDGFRFENGAPSLGGTGIVTGNTAIGNGEDGFRFNGQVDGMVAHNTASNNVGAGFHFIGDVSGTGQVTNNAASNNGGGYVFGNLLASSIVNGNSAIGNTADGFLFNGTLAGTVNGNTASSNGVLGSSIINANANGFSLVMQNAGTFTNNIAFGNGNNGFAGTNDNNFANAVTGTFTGNVANSNGDRGYRGVTPPPGTVSNNTGAGNQGTPPGNTFP